MTNIRRHASPFLLAALMLSGAALHQPSIAEASQDQLNEAAQDFAGYCAPCHGAEGMGDGPVASELVKPPANLTVLAQRAGGTFPEEAVRRMVDGRGMPKAHGTRQMPVWGYWFSLQAHAAGLLQEEVDKAEKEAKLRVDRLVEYLKTIQK